MPHLCLALLPLRDTRTACVPEGCRCVTLTHKLLIKIKIKRVFIPRNKIKTRFSFLKTCFVQVWSSASNCIFVCPSQRLTDNVCTRVFFGVPLTYKLLIKTEIEIKTRVNDKNKQDKNLFHVSFWTACNCILVWTKALHRER